MFVYLRIVLLLFLTFLLSLFTKVSFALGGDEGRPAARHQRGVRGGGGGAPRARRSHPQGRPTLGK